MPGRFTFGERGLAVHWLGELQRQYGCWREEKSLLILPNIEQDSSVIQSLSQKSTQNSVKKCQISHKREHSSVDFYYNERYQFLREFSIKEHHMNSTGLKNQPQQYVKSIIYEGPRVISISISLLRPIVLSTLLSNTQNL